MNATPPKVPTIGVIDDDESVRLATRSLVKSLRFCVIAFASAQEFPESPRFDDVSCSIWDIHMLGIDALKLQQHLALTRPRAATDLHHAFHEKRFRKYAMEAGAIGFFNNHSRYSALSNASRGRSTPSADPDLLKGICRTASLDRLWHRESLDHLIVLDERRIATRVAQRELLPMTGSAQPSCR